MKLKELLLIYLQHRVIVFPLHLYLNSLINNIFKEMDEWNLLKPNSCISGKEKYFKFFLEKEIIYIQDIFDFLFKKLNIKIIILFKEENIHLDFSNFLKDKNLICNSVLKFFSRKTKILTKKISNNLILEPTGQFYKDINIGKTNGNLEEFLLSLKNT